MKAIFINSNGLKLKYVADFKTQFTDKIIIVDKLLKSEGKGIVTVHEKYQIVTDQITQQRYISQIRQDMYHIQPAPNCFYVNRGKVLFYSIFENQKVRIYEGKLLKDTFEYFVYPLASVNTCLQKLNPCLTDRQADALIKYLTLDVISYEQ